MSCGNTTECVTDSEHFELATTDSVEVLFYFLCFVIGGPLNVISLRRSLRAFSQHKAKSPILLLRINLNLADLCTLFVYVPKQFIWMLTYQWYGGELLCRACSFFSTFSFYANSFVIACIAIDRVFGAYNMSSINAHRRAYLRCRRLLVIGWLAAFTLSLPQAVIFRVFEPYPEKDFKQCTPLWTTFLYEKIEEMNSTHLSEIGKLKCFEAAMNCSNVSTVTTMSSVNVQGENIKDLVSRIEQEITDMQRLEKMYNINHLLFVFWIPCIIIVISYLTVLLILQGHLREEYHGLPATAVSQLEEDSSKCSAKGRQPFLDTRSPKSSPMQPCTMHRSPSPAGAMAVSTIHKAKQHAKRQAAWIILAYLTFWSPYNVLAVLNMTRTLSEHQVVSVTLSFLNAAICANPIVNPLIYGILTKTGKQ